jgi:LysR family glycine cleavage system transcriptional activator
MASHGNGAALVSEVLAQSAVASGQLVLAHSNVAPCEEGYYVRANEKNVAAIQFRDWILQQDRHDHFSKS